MTSGILYSVVIPIKNEEENIKPLIEELDSVMRTLQSPWELLIINDGSTDHSAQILNDLKSIYKELRVVHFDRNYGQSSAFDAGFRLAKGEFVITLDGDRQNDPHDIPKLLDIIVKGADLVCGQRKKRKDSFFKRAISKLANAVRSKLCQDGISDTGCSLKVYRKQCLKEIKLFDGMHRFLPALFQIENFRVAEVAVNHRERTAGKSKYNLFNRSFNTIYDMLAVVWMRKRHLKYPRGKLLEKND